MKRHNRDISIFNLSMLDVMTGALGAVMIVMIVLLTQKIGVESRFLEHLPESGFMEPWRTGGNDNAVKPILINIIFNLLLARLGTGIADITRNDHLFIR